MAGVNYAVDTDTWDRVKCALCGKTISMLEADTVKHGERFICKDGACVRPPVDEE